MGECKREDTQRREHLAYVAHNTHIHETGVDKRKHKVNKKMLLFHSIFHVCSDCLSACNIRTSTTTTLRRSARGGAAEKGRNLIRENFSFR